ncbi:hypothetical protein EFN52_06730 [Pediococcus parvulus]|nr:hypothetical protein [Pediococcus parvulus]
MLIIYLLFCRAVLELSGKQQARMVTYAGSQSRGSHTSGSLFDLPSGPRAQRKAAVENDDGGGIAIPQESCFW